jgi:soluble lytic murein transglycosylase-like protein
MSTLPAGSPSRKVVPISSGASPAQAGARFRRLGRVRSRVACVVSVPRGRLFCGSLLASLLLLLVAPAGAQQTYSDPILRDLLRKAADEAVSFPDKYDAQVWLTDMSARLAKQVQDPEERLAILTEVHFEATRAGLAPELVLAVIDVESNFDRFAISRVGARGLMQVMPFWLEEIGRPEANLFRIETNLRFGCTILKYYLDLEKGDLLRALGRYNGSLGRRTYPNLVLDKLRLKWFRL